METSPEVLTNEEKLWGMLAHLLGLAGYFLGVGQYIAPLVIYVLYKDKSKFVAFHALQSLFLQLGLLIVAGILGIASILIITLIITLPLLIALGVVAIVYPIVAGIKAYNGEMYEYWQVGKFARDIVQV